jgi:hypothetical protein
MNNESVRQPKKKKEKKKRGNEPWPIVLDIVFLDFLDMMVGLWEVHPFRTKGFCCQPA